MLFDLELVEVSSWLAVGEGIDVVGDGDTVREEDEDEEDEVVSGGSISRLTVR